VLPPLLLEVVLVSCDCGKVSAVGLDGDEIRRRAFRNPSLCTAQCPSLGVVGGRLAWELMYGWRAGSGVFLPNRDSKELRLLYVNKALIRAAPNPVVGGSSNE